jgi:hypothetical protein
VEKEWSDLRRRSLVLEPEHILLIRVTDCRTQQIEKYKWVECAMRATCPMAGTAT